MRYNDENVQNIISVRSKYSNINVGVSSCLLNKNKADCETRKLSEGRTSNMTESGHVEEVSLLVPFLNFFYYLLLVPFKTVLDPESNQYRLQTHTLHKIFCPFVHANVMISIIFTWLQNLVQFNSFLERSIVLVFDFVSYLAAVFSTLSVIFILWRRKDKYLEVIESTRITWKRGKLIKILIYVALALYSGAWCALSWYLHHDQKHPGSLRSFINKYIPDRNNSSNEDVLLNVLSVAFAHANLFYIASQGPILIFVISLGQLGKTFRTELEMVNDVQKGSELYRSLKRKVVCIAELYGNTLTLSYLLNICYYAEAPHILLGKRGDTEKVQEAVLKWISFHIENPVLSVEDRLKLLSISDEISADPVALSSRYFYMTYQQFSSMLGMVVTYGIIVFQTENGMNCSESCSSE